MKGLQGILGRDGHITLPSMWCIVGRRMHLEARRTEATQVKAIFKGEVRPVGMGPTKERWGCDFFILTCI